MEADADNYRAEVERWHADREARLRSPNGWLALVGLHWLTPGEHEFGQHPSNPIRLSGPRVPPLAGHLLVTDDGAVRVRPHHGAPLTHAGQPVVGELELKDDLRGDPTIVELGSLRFHLIRRGARVGLRVRDAEAPALRTFEGVPRFPVDPAWRLEARLERPLPFRLLGKPALCVACGGIQALERNHALEIRQHAQTQKKPRHSRTGAGGLSTALGTKPSQSKPRASHSPGSVRSICDQQSAMCNLSAL